MLKYRGSILDRVSFCDARRLLNAAGESDPHKVDHVFFLNDVTNILS